MSDDLENAVSLKLKEVLYEKHTKQIARGFVRIENYDLLAQEIKREYGT